MFYPQIEPFDSGYLKVSPIHELYYEQSGNPMGKPVVFLHGGPGSGVDENHRRYFDPDFYRIILFDQRGAGKSLPSACIVENTTFDLVEDMEKLRRHLNIEKWGIFGGSWGSLLGLAYAIHHFDKVAFLILRGIFLSSKEDLNWFFHTGAPNIFPEEYEKLLKLVKPNHSVIDSYYELLNQQDEKGALEAAISWSHYEIRALKLQFDEEFFSRAHDPKKSLSIAKIETHYFKNLCFLPNPDWLLESVKVLKNIPITIVHGRYDMVCPVKNAFLLKKYLPHAELKIAELAGHAGSEVGNLTLLIQALNSYRTPHLFS